jgi:protein-S-isoprenylcysteine O-methyltransferase Ste14
MLVSLRVTFLVLPNAVTLLVLIVSYILIQIRLEEEFLKRVYGIYTSYTSKMSAGWFNIAGTVVLLLAILCGPKLVNCD